MISDQSLLLSTIVLNDIKTHDSELQGQGEAGLHNE